MGTDHRGRAVGKNHSDWARGRRLSQSVRGTDTFIKMHDYWSGRDNAPETIDINPGLHNNVKAMQRGLSISAIEDLRMRASTHPDTAMISLSDDGPDYHGTRIVR